MEKKSSGLKNFIFISILVLMIAGGIAGVYFMVMRVDKAGPQVKYPAETPQDVYSLYNKAAREGNFNKARTYISAQHQALFDTFDEKKIAQEGSYLKNSAPTEYKVTSQKIQGNTAWIMLEGNGKSIIAGGKANFCKVNFALENGEWKISRENWADKPENLK